MLVVLLTGNSGVFKMRVRERKTKWNTERMRKGMIIIHEQELEGRESMRKRN
jgi:hypothetical protein